MKDLLEFLTIFDWLALPRTIFQTFWFADWGAARRRSGAAGVAVEALSSLAGANTYPFFVPLYSPWSGQTLANLLAAKGVRIWGVTYAHGEMFFRVPRRQAAWAQYIMLKAGVPLLHGLHSGPSQPAPAAPKPQPRLGKFPSRRGR